MKPIPRLFVMASIAVALCASSAAHAWGDRERAALIGLVAGAALASSGSPAYSAVPVYPPVVVAPGPVWHRPPPRVAHEVPVPVYGGHGHHGPRFRDDVADAYARGAAERMRLERERAVRDAYWDGYYGR